MVSFKKFIKALNVTISAIGSPIWYLPFILYLNRIDTNMTTKFIVIVITIEVFCAVIKLMFPKDRPIKIPKTGMFQKYRAGSFPSIHSARSVAAPIFLSILKTNWMLIVSAIIMTIGVGYSRIYLKRHYPIDVIGGFIIGAGITVTGLLV